MVALAVAQVARPRGSWPVLGAAVGATALLVSLEILLATDTARDLVALAGDRVPRGTGVRSGAGARSLLLAGALASLWSVLAIATCPARVDLAPALARPVQEPHPHVRSPPAAGPARLASGPAGLGAAEAALPLVGDLTTIASTEGVNRAALDTLPLQRLDLVLQFAPGVLSTLRQARKAVEAAGPLPEPVPPSAEPARSPAQNPPGVAAFAPPGRRRPDAGPARR